MADGGEAKSLHRSGMNNGRERYRNFRKNQRVYSPPAEIRTFYGGIMDRETARQEIRRQIDCKQFLEPSKSGMYCCPYCGSGHGDHGTGAVKVYDTNTFTCHACNRSGDVIDLYRDQTGTDYNTALMELADRAGITIDSYRPTAAADFAPESRQSDYRPQGDKRTATANKGAQRRTEGETEPQDYTEYYKTCKERLKDPAAVEYLQRRGISLETAAAYWIGFDPQADPAGTHHPCPRLIIPASKAHYVARRTDGETAFKAMNPRGSKPAIFNMRALYAPDVQEVFITEGAFDALSVIEVGAPAIALNSAANADALIEQLAERRTTATLILCLDNDDRGKKAAATIRAGLQRLNISYITADICKGYKDPNEALTADRVAFVAAIEQAQRQTAPKPDNTSYYIDTLMQSDIERFKDDVKTGFTYLDEKAGGLYSGLYVLAAISSLGKTSFALQLADQLAEGGKDVLFFSLEQSRLELVSKSLARRTAQKDIDNAVTSLAIRKGYMPQQVKEAAAEYKEAVADRFSIVEGNFSCNISYIGEYIRQYVQRNNTRPIVFIDYLQILQPAEDNQRQSLKETVDNTVTELKRISRELELTVFIISSVNRANYLTPIDFESLKESGGIEFTADVIWGLQLQVLNDPLFDKENKKKEKREKIKEAKAKNPRKIELCCLKNRYGIANYSCYFNYYPANDLFTEEATADFNDEPLDWDDTII